MTKGAFDYHYRYVPFGTRFSQAVGLRSEGELNNAGRLYENEIVLDVGGCCFEPTEGGTLIIDHHFPGGDEALPAASVGVLTKARVIYEELTKRVRSKTRVVWLVTHHHPDFDALASCFLVRCILDQESDYAVPLEGWNGLLSRIDWFEPIFSAAESHRWPILLASYAACIDNCRRLRGHRHEALHSVLYAALLRRGSEFLKNGATSFFQASVAAIRNRQLNPHFDSLLKDNEDWRPELRLLERELTAYQSDIARSRRSLVHLKRCPLGFNQLLSTLEGTCSGDGLPLLLRAADGNPAINPEHLRALEVPPHEGGVEADALFIRDPECVLFKEWARNDTENSLLGKGFTFTAIAYSNGRDSALNRSDYYFSLDPERLPGAHLYNVWARLQAQEVTALHEKKLLKSAKGPRLGFSNRARNFEPYFEDPWFDGQNYGGTIVATPARGTFIGKAGLARDLTDDPVAAIVSDELEYSIFAREEHGAPLVTIREFRMSTTPRAEDRSEVLPLSDGSRSEPRDGHFRFASVELRPDVDLAVPGLPLQIARALWPFLAPSGTARVPDNLQRHHLSAYPNMVAVWNRRGIAVAYQPGATSNVERLRTNLSSLADISSHVERISKSTPAPSQLSQRKLKNAQFRTAEQLLKEVVTLRLESSKPENRPLRQMMDAIQFDDIIQSLHALNQQALGREQEERALFLNLLIGLFALTMALPTLILTFFAVVHGPSEKTIALLSVIPIACGMLIAFAMWFRYLIKRRRGH